MWKKRGRERRRQGEIRGKQDKLKEKKIVESKEKTREGRREKERR